MPETWKWLPDEKPTQKEFSYLIALPDDNDKNVLYPMIAQWHEAGDIVLLNRRMEKPPVDLPEKERLLRLLTDGLYQYKIVTTGFYVMESDKDVPEEFAEKGCEQYLEYLGEELFWSKIPAMPSGYISSDENEYNERLTINEKMKKQHKERIKNLQSQIEEDNYLSQMDIGNIENGINHDLMIFCGTKYSIPSILYAECMTAARKMLDVAKIITDEEIDELANLQEQGNKQKVIALVNTIFDRANVTDAKHKSSLAYILCNTHNNLFVNYRKHYCSYYKNDKSKIVQILTQAKLKKDTIYRILYRFRKLESLGAPEIILLNEFRVFAQEFTAFCCPEYIVGIDEERFGKYFHVNANGEYYDYKDYDYEPGHGIGKEFPYFAVQALPNYMMFQKGWCLRDNRKSYSFIFNDDGTPFKTWDDAKRKADELTKALVSI